MSPAWLQRPIAVLARDAAAVVVLVHDDVELASWPLRWTGRRDLTTVDQLARLQLGARRLGCCIRLCDASVELMSLLDLVGLRIEVGGEAERGEEVGVEEVVVPDDPVT